MKRNAVAWAALVISTASLIGSQNFTRALPAAPEVPAEGQKAAKALSDAFEAVAEFTKPSVVQISVRRKAGTGSLRQGRRAPFPGTPNEEMPKEFEDMLKRFFGPDARPEREQFGFGAEGTGSGFVYDSKGHILTNNHVVEGAEKITVTFHDGTESSATVVGTDPGTDVAVIKADVTDYRAVAKGDSKHLRVGEWVLAVGSPFGLDQTVTAGIVSATERNGLSINEYEAFIQTDASINPGNSGGPLVDMAGRVVGINSAIVTASRSNAGVGFAIPIDMAANIADKLIKDGKINRARLGIQLAPLTPVLAKQFGLAPKTKGVLVAGVVDDSPASKAGLKEGDIVTGYEGETVDSGASLKNLVATSDVGKSYTLTLLRQGKEQKVTVVPASENQVRFAFEQEEAAVPKAKAEAPKPEVNDFGLAVQELTPALAGQFGHGKGTEGLVITAVKEGSPAEAAGLEVGNLITKVIKDKKIQPLKDAQSFRELSGQSDDLALFVQTSEGPGQFVTLSKPKAD